MRNQKGFSLIELFAVIVISTTVLVPLLFSLVGNFEVNARMIRKNAASLVSISAIRGFDQILFSDLNSTPNLDTNYYAEYNQNTCTQLSFVDEIEMCDYIFDLTAQNVTFDDTEYRVFIYPYHITEAQRTSLLSTSDDDIPQAVKDEIDNDSYIRETESDLNILRITVWIRYDKATNDSIVRSGVISRD